jgi:hypothetical protein
MISYKVIHSFFNRHASFFGSAIQVRLRANVNMQYAESTGLFCDISGESIT